MPLPRFDLSVRLGDLLPVLAFLIPFGCWVVNSDSAFDRRLSVLEQTVKVLADAETTQDSRTREAITALDTRMREADAESRTGLRRIDDKISMLFQHLQAPMMVTPMPVVPSPVPRR